MANRAKMPDCGCLEATVGFLMAPAILYGLSLPHPQLAQVTFGNALLWFGSAFVLASLGKLTGMMRHRGRARQ